MQKEGSREVEITLMLLKRFAKAGMVREINSPPAKRLAITKVSGLIMPTGWQGTTK